MADEETFGDRYRARVHRAGMLWNRLVGTLVVVIGGYAAMLSLGSEDFSLATHWPTIAAVAGLWWLARWFFTAREIVIEPVDGEGHSGKELRPRKGFDRRAGTTSGTPLSPAESAARRGDVTINDQGRG